MPELMPDMNSDTKTDTAVLEDPEKHIVDILIEERAEKLISRPLLWKLLKPVVLPLMGYRQAIEAVDHVAEMNGLEIFEYVSSQIKMDVRVDGIERIPKTGSAVVIANHPAGIADGIAVYDALKSVRDDLIFFANRDAVRAGPGLADIIIPVEWVDEKRTHERRKETVKSMVRAFRDNRVVVIFPSGRLAQPTLGGLIERPWQPTSLNLAIKYDTPVVPMHISGHNSWLYYVFYFLHQELRDMTLFRELFNKAGQGYDITLAEPIDPCDELAAHDNNLADLTENLRRFVAEQMPRGVRQFDASS